MLTPRRRFLAYVRDHRSARPVVSPFLPHADVIAGSLELLGLPVSGDPVADEIALARELDYEPMFMTDCTRLIFDWNAEPGWLEDGVPARAITTRLGPWVWHDARPDAPWHDAACPVRTPAAHALLCAVCEQVAESEPRIRSYFRSFRQRVGEGGVIVIGHPHPAWLGYQIAPSDIFYHWHDDPAVFRRSMDAVARAALFVMQVAMEEGIDFMSDSSYGLEMTSPELFREMDLPYIRRFADWTHERGGLFWYHNCGFTKRLIADGTFDALGADLIETIAPPPEGDNDLAESRARLDPRICSKGNLNLQLLRDGAPADVRRETARIVSAVAARPHVISTADAVLPGTRPANYIEFVRAAREL